MPGLLPLGADPDYNALADRHNMLVASLDRLAATAPPGMGMGGPGYYRGPMGMGGPPPPAASMISELSSGSYYGPGPVGPAVGPVGTFGGPVVGPVGPVLPVTVANPCNLCGMTGPCGCTSTSSITAMAPLEQVMQTGSQHSFASCMCDQQEGMVHRSVDYVTDYVSVPVQRPLVLETIRRTREIPTDHVIEVRNVPRGCAVNTNFCCC